jgi:(S)-3,5-dihydroxyphenylglycine transaminase
MNVPTALRLESLHTSLTDPVLESMNFLNEVSQRFPDAISFAAGRPTEELFEPDQLHDYLDAYCAYLAQSRGRTPEQIRRALFQYGRTKGIVHELIATHLAVDEDIQVDPESIVVTVGCQEAMVLVLRALRGDDRDVLLAVSPTYVGLTGAARLVDLPVAPVRSGVDGIDLADLADTVRALRAAGRRPRACYLVPDFANPLGVSLEPATRHELLRLAEELDLLLLEDNPYGLLSAGAARPPTLKALDTTRRVVYLGSFAKTVLPGVRVGFAVADQPVVDRAGHDRGLFADQLSRVKSMLTVNTSPVTQALVAGRLLAYGGSLVAATKPEREVYRRNLHLMLAGLRARFAGEHAPAGVAWSTPAGGFFLVLTVPFRVDDALLEHSAKAHGVLWTPMHHFYADRSSGHQLRLSFSGLDPEHIDTGLDRLATFVAEQCAREAA